jgi:hypothetical protein
MTAWNNSKPFFSSEKNLSPQKNKTKKNSFVYGDLGFER